MVFSDENIKLITFSLCLCLIHMCSYSANLLYKMIICLYSQLYWSHVFPYFSIIILVSCFSTTDTGAKKNYDKDNILFLYPSSLIGHFLRYGIILIFIHLCIYFVFLDQHMVVFKATFGSVLQDHSR